jgi:hypothetical protein
VASTKEEDIPNTLQKSTFGNHNHFDLRQEFFYFTKGCCTLLGNWRSATSETELQKQPHQREYYVSTLK